MTVYRRVAHNDVVPTLLTTREEIEEADRALEVHFLANQEAIFALTSHRLEGLCNRECGRRMKNLLAIAVNGITRLNQRHDPAPEREPVLLFHRRRLWNKAEGKWMGWERSEGKLHELNRLLQRCDRQRVF